jgi:hypothetical protein
MSDTVLLERTRALLLGLSAAMFGATIIELVFAKHTDGWIQLIPFVCCGVGLLMVALIWWNRDGGMVRGTRIVLSLIAAASLFGIYEHLESAYETARYFHPGMGGWELARTTLTSSTPILAPGALAAGALVAIIATSGLPRPVPVPQARVVQRA